jgi:hypothetical protein
MAQAKEFAEVYPVPVDGLNMPAPIVLQASFETGEQGDYRVYTAGKLRVNRVKAIVTKAIAATDNGTITIKDAAGDTIATLTATASDAIGVEYDTGALSDADQDIGKDSFFSVNTAKTTAGGKVLVSVEYSVLPVR